MAAADYYQCDRCGSKAFYDANITDSRYTGPDDPDDISGMIDITVLCPECAETHMTTFVKKRGREDVAADLVPQWQPIETAPKGGEIVLLAHEFWRKCGIGQHRYPEGWCYYADGLEINDQGRLTHWMPLPTPPK